MDFWVAGATADPDNTTVDNTDDTDLKQVAGTEQNNTSRPFGGAQCKTGFPTTPNRPRATIEGMPAGYEDIKASQQILNRNSVKNFTACDNKIT